MAAYHRVDDLTVTCRLTACTPGSARGPALGIEYGKPLPSFLTVINRMLFTSGLTLEHACSWQVVSDTAIFVLTRDVKLALSY